ncbi:hypothetical protein IFHNHDMJ_00862 [Synechococcus sp. CBW1107]|nr:hypothetical protein IFHNHDMJ_00862 [Synechococcus sp. CBW1107]
MANELFLICSDEGHREPPGLAQCHDQPGLRWGGEAALQQSSDRWAVTGALRPPPSLDESLAAQATFISSFLVKDGQLHQCLLACGGILF